MKSSRTALGRVSLAACVLALGGAMGCDDDEGARPHDRRVEEGLQRVVDQAVATPGVFLPGAIAHHRNPVFAPWSGAAGVGDLQAGTPMRPGDRIRAGSILKTFVAAVTLQLVEQGRLSLDQTLPQLLPREVTDRVANAEAITLRMLLQHTSGIPDWVTPKVHVDAAMDPAHVYTIDEILEIAAGMEPYFTPGAAYHYSNTDYTLLGMVLDRAGGSSWRAQVRARVLEPLGLWSTSLPEPGDRTTPGEYAHGYVDVGGTPIDLSTVDPSMAGAAGGNALVTTVEDLGRFLDALLAGELFARHETLVDMTTMIAAPDETGIHHRYGLGIESYEVGGTTVVGHGGGAAGYAVMMFRIPSRATTLVTAINVGDLGSNAVNVLGPSVDVILGGRN